MTTRNRFMREPGDRLVPLAYLEHAAWQRNDTGTEDERPEPGDVQTVTLALRRYLRTVEKERSPGFWNGQGIPEAQFRKRARR